MWKWKTWNGREIRRGIGMCLVVRFAVVTLWSVPDSSAPAAKPMAGEIRYMYRPAGYQLWVSL